MPDFLSFSGLDLSFICHNNGRCRFTKIAFIIVSGVVWGGGKVSALFFREGNIQKFDIGYGQKLAPLTYGFLTVIPLIFLSVSIFQEFAIFKVIILILLLLVSIYSGAINRKKTCSKCRMRLICPGCAVK